MSTNSVDSHVKEIEMIYTALLMHPSGQIDVVQCHGCDWWIARDDALEKYEKGSVYLLSLIPGLHTEIVTFSPKSVGEFGSVSVPSRPLSQFQTEVENHV
jgi:hypothetical protein